MNIFRSPSTGAASTCIDNSKTGVGFDRPNYVGGTIVNSNWGSGLPQYLNPAALAENPTGPFGDLGRNAVYGPGTFESMRR